MLLAGEVAGEGLGQGAGPQELGIGVQRQLAHEVPANPASQRYLAVKRERLGHRLVLPVVVQGRGAAPV